MWPSGFPLWFPTPAPPSSPPHECTWWTNARVPSFVTLFPYFFLTPFPPHRIRSSLCSLTPRTGLCASSHVILWPWHSCLSSWLIRLFSVSICRVHFCSLRAKALWRAHTRCSVKVGSMNGRASSRPAENIWGHRGTCQSMGVWWQQWGAVSCILCFCVGFILSECGFETILTAWLFSPASWVS